MVHKMTDITIEEMTIMSYVLLVVAIVLGIVAVVLFFTLRIPKAYRAVKGHGHNRKRYHGKKKTRHVSQRKKSKKSHPETVKLRDGWEHDSEIEVLCEETIHFTMLQDITYVHVEEEL